MAVGLITEAQAGRGDPGSRPGGHDRAGPGDAVRPRAGRGTPRRSWGAAGCRRRKQYWRSQPRELKQLFGATVLGQR
ncbi:MAG: hypothetical protein WDN49_13080 [Acetobacteraceae bacterium]